MGFIVHEIPACTPCFNMPQERCFFHPKVVTYPFGIVGQVEGQAKSASQLSPKPRGSQNRLSCCRRFLTVYTRTGINACNLCAQVFGLAFPPLDAPGQHKRVEVKVKSRDFLRIHCEALCQRSERILLQNLMHPPSCYVLPEQVPAAGYSPVATAAPAIHRQLSPAPGTGVRSPQSQAIQSVQPSRPAEDPQERLPLQHPADGAHQRRPRWYSYSFQLLIFCSCLVSVTKFALSHHHSSKGQKISRKNFGRPKD